MKRHEWFIVFLIGTVLLFGIKAYLNVANQYCSQEVRYGH